MPLAQRPSPQRRSSQRRSSLVLSDRNVALAKAVTLVAAALAAACFDPRTQEGLACTETDGCPVGQDCIDGQCYRPGSVVPVDATVDATSIRCSTEVLATGQTSATDLDAQDSEYVYWTNSESSLVLRSPKVRGPLEVFHDSGQGRHPHGVVTDATHVYWTESDSVGRVVRKPKASLEAEPLEELAVGQGEPVAIAVDAANVYWANLGGNSINRVGKVGGAVELLATSQLRPTTIALDSNSVYWQTSGSGTLMRVAKVGPPLQQLAATPGAFGGLSVSGDSVYWTDSISGELRAVAKAGGASALVAGGLGEPGAIAANAAALYWGDFQRREVMVQSRATGTIHQVAGDQGAPVALEVADDDVYWLNRDDADNRLVRASCNPL